MVLATKSKNIKFSKKALAVILSILFMAGAAAFAIGFFDVCQNTYRVSNFIDGKEDKNDYSGSSYVYSLLSSDLTCINNKILLEDTKGINAFLKSQKVQAVNKIFSEYKARKDEYLQSGYTSDGGIEFDINYNLYYNGLTLNLASDNDNAYQEYRVLFTDDDNEAKTKIESIYDDFSALNDYSPYCLPGESVHNGLCYCVINPKNGMRLTNFPKGTELNDVLSNKYAVVIKNGVPQYSKAFNGVLKNAIDPSTKKLNNVDVNNEYYLYINENASGDNAYLNTIKAYESASKRNFKADFVLAVIMAILALICAVWCFVNAGSRREDSSVKLAFIDRIPFDLHFILSAGTITGLIYLLGLAGDELNGSYRENFNQFVLSASLMIAAVWAIFIELVTSLVRLCKSKEKFYKNLFILKVLKFTVADLIIKPVKFIVKKIKTLLNYKPENFKKDFSRYVILYAVIEIMLFATEIFFLTYNMPLFAGISGAVIVVFNAVLLAFCVRYAILLDKIISCAKKRAPFAFDYEKLPQSLKTLVDSLDFTREELDSAVSKAVSNERMKSELITNVSHDLKTPLTSIVTYVDLLKSCKVDDDKEREYISVLDEKSKRLKRLIDDLIEASKITSGVITLNPVELSLTELAAQAVGERFGEFNDSGLELVFDAKENVRCFADGNKTFRILDNLLSNAKKYSLKGTRVYSSVYSDNNNSVFEIKNTSAQMLNITPNELKQRFVRGDKSRTDGGSGLGLSIADNLCEAQKGRLEIIIDGDLFKAKVYLPKS